LNENEEDNLLLYVNLRLVQSVSFKEYGFKLSYDENTIGCNGTERYFFGEITSLCFFEITSKTLQSTHNALEKYGKDVLEMTGEPNNELWEKLFLYASPKCTEKSGSSVKQVLTIKNKYKVYNNVERVYPRTNIELLTLPKDSFFNFGGIKLLIPLVYKAINNDFT
jgi:hypothetical protein